MAAAAERAVRSREWRDVGADDEFPELQMRIVRIANRLEVGVVRAGDRAYAVRNVCPHMAGPLCAGQVRPAMGGERVGELQSAPDDLVIACAWHGWEYHLDTGRSVVGTKDRVRVYPARIRSGRLEIEV
jgi:nitrite reductase/ring-hydroxylating ferredoxin subunit